METGHITMTGPAAELLADRRIRCSLTSDDDGIYSLRWDGDGDALYTATADQLPKMLIFVKEVNAGILRRQQSEAINGACTTNSPRRPRGRPLNPEVTERRRRITEMAERFQPASIRQLYYQAEVAGLVPKTDAGYRAVQHDRLVLRQQGDIEYDWISDSTRWMRKARSYTGVHHFLDLSISTYRRDLWHRAPVYVEIWIEKDALAGTVMSETNPSDVPLMVAKGFSSETYLYEAAQAIADKNKPAYIYAFFDHDPSGKHSAKHIERKLREFAPGAEIHFELVAVTKEQIEQWGLPTRETKRKGNRHAKSFEGDSCELDSIPPTRSATSSASASRSTLTRPVSTPCWQRKTANAGRLKCLRRAGGRRHEHRSGGLGRFRHRPAVGGVAERNAQRQDNEGAILLSDTTSRSRRHLNLATP